MKNDIRFAFFGSSSFSLYVLDELEKAGYVPAVVVTMPDKPKGRHLALSPTEAKVWATERKIPVLTPTDLKDATFQSDLARYTCEVSIVASYGKIIPEAVLSMPARKTLNVHPSLLPAYRGSSPVQSMILSNEQHVGVTIMELDKEMDHGPIVASKEIKPKIWPIAEEPAKEFLGREGGKLLASVLPEWIKGSIQAVPQDHAKATYTKKITKEEGLLDMTGDPHTNYLKILAYHRWPKAYFFDDHAGKKTRIVVTEATYKDGVLTLVKVIPEGKKEMLYSDYLRGKR